MCAKFQLSSLIFSFISCQQLLSAVDSCSAVENYFWHLDSHIGPKVGFFAKFQLDWLTGSRATECDGQLGGQTTGQTPGEYSANSGPARLVPGPELSKF